MAALTRRGSVTSTIHRGAADISAASSAGQQDLFMYASDREMIHYFIKPYTECNISTGVLDLVPSPLYDHAYQTVVEHVVLFKFKDGYTDEQENNTYKGLWTFKDRFPSIMAMSLGRVLSKNAEHVTHALVMRFASKEVLDTYLNDPWRVEISYKYIVPFFNGELTADFEAEVDTDLSQLYRDNEKFNEGVEHIELFKVKEGVPIGEVQVFLNAVADLPKHVQIDIVQLTSGTNYKPNEKFTHAVILHLPSVEGLAALIEDSAYVDLLTKFYPILDDHLRVDFLPEESKKKINEDFSS